MRQVGERVGSQKPRKMPNLQREGGTMKCELCFEEKGELKFEYVIRPTNTRKLVCGDCMNVLVNHDVEGLNKILKKREVKP